MNNGINPSLPTKNAVVAQNNNNTASITTDDAVAVVKSICNHFESDNSLLSEVFKHIHDREVFNALNFTSTRFHSACQIARKTEEFSLFLPLATTDFAKANLPNLKAYAKTYIEVHVQDIATLKLLIKHLEYFEHVTRLRLLKPGTHFSGQNDHHEIKNMAKLKNLKMLFIETIYQGGLTIDELPSNLTELRVDRFDGELILNKLPTDLTKISLGSISASKFNLEKNLPPTLQYLSIRGLHGYDTHSTWDLSNLPKSLTYLSLGSLCVPVAISTLPPRLEHFSFGYVSYSITLPKVLPDTLKYLEMGQMNEEMNFPKLPNDLTHLIVGTYWYELTLLRELPQKLVHLSLSNIGKEIAFDLPDSLEYVNLGTISAKVSAPKIPTSIKCLIFEYLAGRETLVFKKTEKFPASLVLDPK